MNSILSTPTYIKNDISAVEQLMASQADQYHPDLQKAIKILLSTGGKRVRPLLILLIAKMLGADKSKSIILASSIELLHTATLVHDDLIDGALLRRGVPTLNSQWSPAATVLTGDFLFSCAANLAAQTQSIEVVQLFSQTLITIVNGEINQMFSSKCNSSRDDYYKRIYAKTASLFETATTSASLISNSSKTEIDSLKHFGYNLGMAFQIVDDILDYVGSESSLGKPVGGDLRQGLLTAPLLFYLENHPENPDLQDLINGNCIQNSAKIDHLITEIAASDAISMASSEANNFAEKAKSYLTLFPDTQEKESLIEIADFIVNRDL